MIICGDALTELRKLPDESVHCCVTSPPYWGLRDYGIEEQLGLEPTPEAYVAKLVEIFREVKRILQKDGTLWLNLGDSYCGSWGNSGQRPELDNETDGQRPKKTEYLNRGGWDSRREVPPNQKISGLKPKDLVGIPWRVVFALQADGWYLRSDIIWSKPNPMPESVTDRPTKSHEYIFLLSKSAKYYFDSELIREPIKETTIGEASVRTSGDSRTRDKEHWAIPHERIQVVRKYETIKGANCRSVWTITTKPMPKIFGAEHFATFPPEIPERCIKAGCPQGGVVLDPFFGAGTTGLVAFNLGCDFIGIELNPKYCDMAKKRIYGELMA